MAISTFCPPRSGWQTWQSVSTTVTLSAGTHTLRVYVPAGGQAVNLNWFDVQRATGGAARTARELPHTTAAARRASCTSGVRPSSKLSSPQIAAACFGA